MPPPSRAHRIASNPSPPKSAPSPTPSAGSSRLRNENFAPDPVIPPINAYGTFQPPKKVSSSSLRQLRRTPSQTSIHSAHGPLQAARQTPHDDDMLNKVSGDLIPFAGFYNSIRGWFTGKRKDSNSLPTSVRTNLRRWIQAIQCLFDCRVKLSRRVRSL